VPEKGQPPALLLGLSGVHECPRCGEELARFELIFRLERIMASRRRAVRWDLRGADRAEPTADALIGSRSARFTDGTVSSAARELLRLVHCQNCQQAEAKDYESS
jgi:hypothetical protein